MVGLIQAVCQSRCNLQVLAIYCSLWHASLKERNSKLFQLCRSLTSGSVLAVQALKHSKVLNWCLRSSDVGQGERLICKRLQTCISLSWGETTAEARLWKLIFCNQCHLQCLIISHNTDTPLPGFFASLFFLCVTELSSWYHPGQQCLWWDWGGRQWISALASSTNTFHPTLFSGAKQVLGWAFQHTRYKPKQFYQN